MRTQIDAGSMEGGQKIEVHKGLDGIEGPVISWYEKVIGMPNKIYIFELGREEARLSEVYVGTGEIIESAGIKHKFGAGVFYDAQRERIRADILFELKRVKNIKEFK